MATSYTLPNGPFPQGTTVQVFDALSRRDGAAPAGSQVTSGSMGASNLVLTGLTESTSYVAYAQVSGVHTYVYFWVPPIPAPEGGDADDWDDAATYGFRRLAIRSHLLYRSLVGGNVGNDPALDDGTNWELLGGAPLEVTEDDLGAAYELDQQLHMAAVLEAGASVDCVFAFRNLPPGYSEGFATVTAGDDDVTIALPGDFTVDIPAGGTRRFGWNSFDGSTIDLWLTRSPPAWVLRRATRWSTTAPSGCGCRQGPTGRSGRPTLRRRRALRGLRR
jgi:hypothetical protein